MPCQIWLCGPPSIRKDGSLEHAFRHKTIALIAYLAVEARPKNRDTLAALLWPASGQAAARGNLRTALHDAARMLPASMLASSGQMLELRQSADVRVDVWELRRALQTPAGGSTEIELLSEAAALWRGEFLEGFSLPDCSDFDLWQLQASELIRQQYAFLLSRLVKSRLAKGAASEAVESVVRLVALDPLEEASHRLAIEVYARSGRWAAALGQFEECRRILHDELEAEPDAETLNLVEEVRRRSARFHPSGTVRSEASRGVVRPPASQTSFYGREGELEILQQIFSRGDRLTTITGPPGVGKTRLALESTVANEAAFPDGIAFCELTATRDPKDVARMIGASIGLQQRSSLDEATIKAISEHLTGRRMLVLLDNFEHLAAAAAVVARIVENSETVQFLVTSREPLHVSSETIVRLAPLQVPDPGSAEALASCPAIRLFIDRAQSQLPELTAELRDLDSVGALCSALDGLPLAIELAVPLLRVYSLTELPSRLSSPLEYLEQAGRDLPERHRSLERAIEWSYSLLRPGEKRLLLRLSVLANGFDSEAAESVGSLGSHSEFQSSFAALLDKSLVQLLATKPCRKYALLESTREYASARLAAGEELQDIGRRHAEYFENLARKAESELHGPNQMQWIETLEAAHPNLLSALRYLLSNGCCARGLECVTALEWYWYRRGQYRLGIEQTERFLSRTSELFTPTRARALHALGWFTFLVGDWRAGHYLYAQSLHLSRQVDDPVCEQLALSDLGVAERWLGDVASGTRHARAAIDVARRRGSPYSLARALVWAYATTGGSFVDCYPRRELEEAVVLAERCGDPWLVAHAHNGLGDLHCATGHGEEARAHYALALHGFLNLGDRFLAAWTLEGMGRVEALCGELQLALERTFEALSLFDSLGDDLNVALMIAREVGMLKGMVPDSKRAALAGAASGLVNARSGEDLAQTPQVNEAMSYLSGLDQSYPAEWYAGRALARATAVAETRALVEAASLAP